MSDYCNRFDARKPVRRLTRALKSNSVLGLVILLGQGLLFGCDAVTPSDEAGGAGGEGTGEGGAAQNSGAVAGEQASAGAIGTNESTSAGAASTDSDGTTSVGGFTSSAGASGADNGDETAGASGDDGGSSADDDAAPGGASSDAAGDDEEENGAGAVGGIGGATDDDAADDGMHSGNMGSSVGCGSPPGLASGNATISVDGTDRDYILKVPDDYDPSKPYKLVFGLHWRGGQASDVANGTIGLGNYYGLEALADGSTIFVAPDGIDDGWANTGGRDIAFMTELISLLTAELCIDQDRIFSVGFSFGGMMSFALACEMADVFRAVAPLSGALYSGCGNGTEAIALWGAHGQNDDVVPIGDGRAGLQEVLDRNHCGTETVATEPSPCVSYQGCDEGYPVTWCEFDGGHTPLGWQSQPIWDFFSQF